MKEMDHHKDMKRVCGDVRHCTVEIPFHLFVDVKGAQDGDTCVVEDAIITAEFDKLIDPNCDGTFNKLLEMGAPHLQPAARSPIEWATTTGGGAG
jgi:hypothetical protein